MIFHHDNVTPHVQKGRNGMKTVLITVFIIIAVVNITFIILGRNSRSGNAAGLIDGLLSRCPDKPNCTCSEYKDDAAHYIDPIFLIRKDMVEINTILKEVVEESGGTIQAEADNYIASTFTSAVFGFTDDVELRVDSVQNVIHIRSASRTGYSDFGVNKRRAELLKELFDRKVKTAD